MRTAKHTGAERKRGVFLAAERSRSILAIDPGTTQSAYAMIRQDYSIISAAKVENDDVLRLVQIGDYDEMVIECMEARHVQNGVIGAETYDTCYWIGRYMQAAIDRGKPVHRVYRSEERKRLVPTKKNRLPPHPASVGQTADSQIRATLIRRFAKHDFKNGKGKATCKDTFYGFAKDMWSAYAVGVVFLDRRQEEALKRRLNG